MQLIRAEEALAQKFIDEIPELVYSTGPVSYDYHFGRRSLFDAIVRRSWLTPGTLFDAQATTLALDGEELMGIEIGFHGPEFRQRQAGLGTLWEALISESEVTLEEIRDVLKRNEHARWLNPEIRRKRYYIHAIAVKPEHRGKRIGVALMDNAKRQGRQMECTRLELDVLSDNPATHFYRSQGLQLLVESRAPKPQEYGVPPEWRMGMRLDGEISR